MYEIVWTGNDESGYVGSINGVQFYEVKTLLCASPPRRKNPQRKYLYFPDRLYGDFEATPSPETAAEAKAQCETDYTYNGGAAAFHKYLDRALAIVKAAGYRVTKLKSKSNGKDRVGPTFVAEFADGTVTRMSTFTSLENLDWGRGERLSQAAYEARWRAHQRKQFLRNPAYRMNLAAPFLNLVAPAPPAIISARFEQDGKVLGTRP